MRNQNLIGVFYIPYVPVKGFLKMPSLGVTKVNITKSKAMMQSREMASLECLHTVDSLLNCLVS